MHTHKLAAMALAAILAIATNVAAQQPPPEPQIPLSSTPSVEEAPKPLTYAQQVARFESNQRILRMEWNKWIGYDAARPHMNASYMSNGMRQYYIPSRALIVTGGHTRTWYW